jgi:hypothetical protein
MAIYFPTSTNSLYGSGAVSAFVPGGRTESTKASGAPGVNGVFVLGMGIQRGPSMQVGVLITATKTSMTTLKASIESNLGSTGYLKDNFGRVYSGLRLISYEDSGPMSVKGNGVQQPYRCVYVKVG